MPYDFYPQQSHYRNPDPDALLEENKTNEDIARTLLSALLSMGTSVSDTAQEYLVDPVAKLTGLVDPSSKTKFSEPLSNARETIRAGISPQNLAPLIPKDFQVETLKDLTGVDVMNRPGVTEPFTPQKYIPKELRAEGPSNDIPGIWGQTKDALKGLASGGMDVVEGLSDPELVGMVGMLGGAGLTKSPAAGNIAKTVAASFVPGLAKGAKESVTGMFEEGITIPEILEKVPPAITNAMFAKGITSHTVPKEFLGKASTRLLDQSGVVNIGGKKFRTLIDDVKALGGLRSVRPDGSRIPEYKELVKATDTGKRTKKWGNEVLDKSIVNNNTGRSPANMVVSLNEQGWELPDDGGITLLEMIEQDRGAKIYEREQDAVLHPDTLNSADYVEALEKTSGPEKLHKITSAKVLGHNETVLGSNTSSREYKVVHTKNGWDTYSRERYEDPWKKGETYKSQKEAIRDLNDIHEMKEMGVYEEWQKSLEVPPDKPKKIKTPVEKMMDLGEVPEEFIRDEALKLSAGKQPKILEPPFKTKFKGIPDTFDVAPSIDRIIGEMPPKDFGVNVLAGQKKIPAKPTPPQEMWREIDEKVWEDSVKEAKAALESDPAYIELEDKFEKTSMLDSKTKELYSKGLQAEGIPMGTFARDLELPYTTKVLKWKNAMDITEVANALYDRTQVQELSAVQDIVGALHAKTHIQGKLLQEANAEPYIKAGRRFKYSKEKLSDIFEHIETPEQGGQTVFDPSGYTMTDPTTGAVKHSISAWKGAPPDPLVLEEAIKLRQAYDSLHKQASDFQVKHGKEPLPYRRRYLLREDLVPQAAHNNPTLGRVSTAFTQKAVRKVSGRKVAMQRDFGKLHDSYINQITNLMTEELSPAIAKYKVAMMKLEARGVKDGAAHLNKELADAFGVKDPNAWDRIQATELADASMETLKQFRTEKGLDAGWLESIFQEAYNQMYKAFLGVDSFKNMAAQTTQYLLGGNVEFPGMGAEAGVGLTVATYKAMTKNLADRKVKGVGDKIKKAIGGGLAKTFNKTLTVEEIAEIAAANPMLRDLKFNPMEYQMRGISGREIKIPFTGKAIQGNLISKILETPSQPAMSYLDWSDLIERQGVFLYARNEYIKNPKIFNETLDPLELETIRQANVKGGSKDAARMAGILVSRRVMGIYSQFNRPEWFSHGIGKYVPFRTWSQNEVMKLFKRAHQTKNPAQRAALIKTLIYPVMLGTTVALATGNARDIFYFSPAASAPRLLNPQSAPFIKPLAEMAWKGPVAGVKELAKQVPLTRAATYSIPKLFEGSGKSTNRGKGRGGRGKGRGGRD